MTINEFRVQIDAVKWFEKNEDYQEFDKLVSIVTGNEGLVWLDCLLDAICVKDDYGPYEGLYNAIWSFPLDIVGRRLAEYLPMLSQRMRHAPFQVWRFYIPVPQQEQSSMAFLETARMWSKDELTIGRGAIQEWCQRSAHDEKAWASIYRNLGGRLPKAPPIDAVPDSYDWPVELQQRLAAWRALPAEKNSVRVFWFGGSDTNFETWRADLPHVVEALALRHGEKWRDVNVWMNPFGTFGKSLYTEFVEAFVNASEDVRNRAMANVKKARKSTFDDLCDKLKSYDIQVARAVWPEDETE